MVMMPGAIDLLNKTKPCTELQHFCGKREWPCQKPFKLFQMPWLNRRVGVDFVGYIQSYFLNLIPWWFWGKTCFIRLFWCKMVEDPKNGVFKVLAFVSCSSSQNGLPRKPSSLCAIGSRFVTKPWLGLGPPRKLTYTTQKPEGPVWVWLVLCAIGSRFVTNWAAARPLHFVNRYLVTNRSIFEPCWNNHQFDCLPVASQACDGKAEVGSCQFGHSQGKGH